MSSEITFRKRYFAVCLWVCVAIMTGLFVIAATASHSAGLIAVAVIFAAFVYVLWLIGAHSAVRMGRDGVIVDNLLARHVIPWSQLAARMTAARDQILGGSPSAGSDGHAYRLVIGFSPWPPLVILAVLEAIAVISLVTG